VDVAAVTVAVVASGMAAVILVWFIP
jgi:hypothetical protein